jgi:cell division septation protein DedD
MASDPGAPPPPRELRLEGPSLWIAVVALLALFAGAFEAGRWVERSGERRAASEGVDPLSDTSPEPESAPEKVTFFDATSGGGKEAEPSREAARGNGGASTPARTPPKSAGPWYVQVFVGRDRAAAEEVVHGLEAKGYPVATAVVSEGGGDNLFKVRVGGYPTRDDAESTAVKLHQDGQPSTWVVRVGG